MILLMKGSHERNELCLKYMCIDEMLALKALVLREN